MTVITSFDDSVKAFKTTRLFTEWNVRVEACAFNSVMIEVDVSEMSRRSHVLTWCQSRSTLTAPSTIPLANCM